ncbi:PqqD family protein [uncultured Parasphingorhabdus sp.]|uniref:PqqD family protein n=1 Tax=uncultured Parasphingorhabdus sp. TaxID=2709694 RepID=UPI00374A6515
MTLIESSVMDPATTICRNPEIMFTELGDKTMTMNIETGNYHELNSIGSAIWREIEQPVQIDLLRDRLCNRYDVSPEQCLSEMSDFLTELSALQMVVVGKEQTGN